MLGPKSSSVDAGRAKHFRFAVTWSSLTAHLEPCEINDLAEATSPPIQASTYIQESALSPASRIASPLSQNEDAESAPDARWEMVVPRMVRPHPRPGPTVPSLPMMKTAPSGIDFQPPKPLLLRALAAIGRGSRKLLAGPEIQLAAEPMVALPYVPQSARAFQTLGLNAPAPILPDQAAPAEEAKNRRVAIELALARLISALNRRSERAGSFAASMSDEPGRSGLR
jgi:hypothetical protein